MALTINDDGAGGDSGHGESVRAKFVNKCSFGLISGNIIHTYVMVEDEYSKQGLEWEIMRNNGGLTLRILRLDEYAGGGNGLVTATVTLNCTVAPAFAGVDVGWLAISTTVLVPYCKSCDPACIRNFYRIA